MKIKKLNEYLVNTVHQHDYMLTEMARINDKKTFNYDVFVRGGPAYGSGRKEHGEPHFHFSDNIENPDKFSFSILIPTELEWKQNKELYITETITDYNWSGFRKEKKELTIWLDQQNKWDKNKTNLQFIILQWNVLNGDNKNVRQI